jgi:peptidoglycan hydrolase CwlO-like protein
VVVRNEERDKELRKLDEKIEQLRAKIQEREREIEDGPRWRTTAT